VGAAPVHAEAKPRGERVLEARPAGAHAEVQREELPRRIVDGNSDEAERRADAERDLDHQRQGREGIWALRLRLVFVAAVVVQSPAAAGRKIIPIEGGAGARRFVDDRRLIGRRGRSCGRGQRRQ